MATESSQKISPRKWRPEWTHEGWMEVMARNGVSGAFLVGGAAWPRPAGGTEHGMYGDMRTRTPPESSSPSGERSE